MNIIIPCSGIGKRFLNAGFEETKPLININNKKIIDYVISMFDVKNDNFIFICNEENRKDIESYVRSNYSFKCFFNSIAYPSYGPVGAIVKSLDFIKDHLIIQDGICISYCDYFQKFDYKEFKEYVSCLDGCIVSYTGYHPHLIPEKNVYATSIVDEKNNVLKIFEKTCIGNKFQAHHSCGLYYFKNIEIIEKYFNELIKRNISLNDEYYVSLVYNLLIEDSLVVKSFVNTSTFLQLGTPEDFRYVEKQFTRFEKLSTFNEFEKINHITLMAGRSKRFKDAGYPIQKSFLTINDSMVYLIQKKYMPDQHKLFITADDYKKFLSYDKDLEYSFVKPNTVGPAYSFFEGIKDVNLNHEKSLITSCDVLCNYYTDEFVSIEKDYDVIVFATQNHITSINNPYSFSWIDHCGPIVKKVSIKKPIENEDIKESYMLIGSFYVKNTSEFIGLIEEFLKKKDIEAKEYYIDEAINYCIEGGLNVGTCLVEGYYSFGTPEEYEESSYWLNYFGG